jgi:hypothetical protein
MLQALEMYEGHWKEGQFDGQGTLFYKDGRRFVGTFSKNQILGEGKLYAKAGHVLMKGHFGGQSRLYFVEKEIKEDKIDKKDEKDETDKEDKEDLEDKEDENEKKDLEDKEDTEDKKDKIDKKNKKDKVEKEDKEKEDGKEEKEKDTEKHFTGILYLADGKSYHGGFSILNEELKLTGTGKLLDAKGTELGKEGSFKLVN